MIALHEFAGWDAGGCIWQFKPVKPFTQLHWGDPNELTTQFPAKLFFYIIQIIFVYKS